MRRQRVKWFEQRKLGLPLQPTYFFATQYTVVMVESDEGFAVSCPALPGCHSQDATHDEALANIRGAIQLWLEVAEEAAQREAEAEGALHPQACHRLIGPKLPGINQRDAVRVFHQRHHHGFDCQKRWADTG